MSKIDTLMRAANPVPDPNAALTDSELGALLLLLVVGAAACSDSATPTNITGTLPERTTQPPEETQPV